MVDITERLRQMDADGCRPVGDDSCTCVVLLDAIAEIDHLRAEVGRLEGVINHAGALACQAASPEHIRSVLADDGYLPGLNSTMCDAPLRSPDEQFTRRMLREAIARCLLTGLPDEREWKWAKNGLEAPSRRVVATMGGVFSFIEEAPGWPWSHAAFAAIPAPIWAKAWREYGMGDWR